MFLIGREHTFAQHSIALTRREIIGDHDIALISIWHNRAEWITRDQGQLPVLRTHGDTRIAMVDDGGVGDLVAILHSARGGDDDFIAELQMLQEFEMFTQDLEKYREVNIMNI